MDKPFKTLAPSPNMIGLMGNTFSKMHGYIMEPEYENLFPARTGDRHGPHKYTTTSNAHHDDQPKKPDYYFHDKNTSGIHAIISGIHGLLRAQAFELHKQNEEALNTAMDGVLLSFPHHQFIRYIDTMRSILRDIPLDKEYERSLVSRHIDAMDALIREHAEHFTLKEKIDILRSCVPAYAALRSCWSRKEQGTYIGRADDALKELFGDIKDNVASITHLELTLKDGQGNSYPVVLSGKKASFVTGTILSGLAGHLGLANHQAVPSVWGDQVQAMIGISSQAAVSFQKCCDYVAGAVRSQHSMKKRALAEVLGESGFTLHGDRLYSFYTMLKREIPDAAFQEYVMRMSGGDELGSAKLPPLYEMFPMLEEFNKILKDMNVGRKAMIEVPEVKELRPSTRFDYYGLLGAIQDIWPKDIASFDWSCLNALRASLCPEQHPNNLMKGSYAQETPDPRQMAQIIDVLGEIKTASVRLPRLSSTPYLESLLELAQRQPERSARSYA